MSGIMRRTHGCVCVHVVIFCFECCKNDQRPCMASLSPPLPVHPPSSRCISPINATHVVHRLRSIICTLHPSQRVVAQHPPIHSNGCCQGAWVMGCSLFFRHVSKFLMGPLPHKSPCVDCGNGQWNEQASSPYSRIMSVIAWRSLSSGPMLTYPLPG